MSVRPQLTVQDFAGLHNGDQDASRARLLRSGSYKRQRVVVVIPAVAPVWPKVYLSHCSLGFPPNNGVVRILAEGMEVGDAYSHAVEGVLAHPELSKWEFLLTLESDNTPPPDGVIRLIEAMEEHPEFAAIGGAYFTKGPGGVLQAWGDPKDPVTNYRPQLPDPAGGLVECCGTGMGLTLFRLAMFKDERLRRPWFKTVSGAGGYATQDLYAWSDFRKHGYRCAVHCGVRVGHYDGPGTYGPPDTTW